MHWSDLSPWARVDQPGLEWLVPWCKTNHVAYTMTVRDGLRSWLRLRCAQLQTDAALAWLLAQDPPRTPEALDALLSAALVVGRAVPAYPHNPLPGGEFPQRQVKKGTP